MDEPGGILPGGVALDGDEVRQVHHLPAVAAGKDPGDRGLEEPVGYRPVAPGVQRHPGLGGDLVFRDQAHGEEEGVTVHPPPGAGDGAAGPVHLAQFHPLQPPGPEDPGDGGLEVEGDAEVVEALDYVPLQPPGGGALFGHAQHLGPLQGEPPGHDQADVPGPQEHHPAAHHQVFGVHQVLGGAGGVYPCRPGAGDGDGPPGPLPAAGGQHHRPRLAVEQPLPGDGGEAAVRGEAGDHGSSAQMGPGGQGLSLGPVGVLRAGEGLPVPDEAKAVVDALVENAPHLVLPLQHQDGGCPCLLSALGGGQTSGAAAHDDHVIVRLVHSFTLPVNSGDPAPR